MNKSIASVFIIMVMILLLPMGCGLVANEAPNAYIESISPNPAIKGEEVSFAGYGSDVDGTVVAYHWNSSIDGYIGTTASFTTSKLSTGTHNIVFTVRDNDEALSDAVTRILIVSEEIVNEIDEELENLHPAQRVIYEYWAAFNRYDLEEALSYYEESYREPEREGVRKEINLLRTFGITLEVVAVSEPSLISEGKVELSMELNTPIGPKYNKYQLVDIDGEWKIHKEWGYEPTE